MKKPNGTPSSWPLLLTTQAVLTSAMEAQLDKAGLPPLAWYDVLWALERAPQHKLRMHELADYVVLTRSNLTRLVDRLVEAKLVRREADPEDRRGTCAVLDEAGMAMRRKMWPVYSAAIESMYDAHLTEDEQRVLGSALRKVLDAARGVVPA